MKERAHTHMIERRVEIKKKHQNNVCPSLDGRIEERTRNKKKKQTKNEGKKEREEERILDRVVRKNDK